MRISFYPSYHCTMAGFSKCHIHCDSFKGKDNFSVNMDILEHAL